MFAKVVSWLKLIRVHNLLLILVGVFISVSISQYSKDLSVEYLDIISISLFISIPPLLVASAGYIRNDYFDLETDRISKPWRPLVRGDIEPETANKTALALYLTALIYSIASIGWATFLFTLYNILITDLYDSKFKKSGLIGNIMVSLATANVFIYGSLAFYERYSRQISFSPYALIPFLFAFLLSISRELIKGVEDIRGDRRLGVKTLAITRGYRETSLASLIICLILLPILILPLTLIFSYSYLVLSIVSIVLSIVASYRVFNASSEEEAIERAREARSITKVSMLVGILAFLTWLLI
ncbi:MAG: geranylgeranylglycerol-phosphate geranylgeranyltransferase [Sulfolobales archaeon]